MLSVKSIEYKAIARKSDSAFTRSRKLPLFALILTLLERRGLALSMEILGFKEKSIVKETFSQTAYSNARQKLKPEAVAKLYKDYNREVYEQVEMTAFKGYLLLAADGSSINVPTTSETVEKYGSSSRKGTKPQATLGLSVLHDVLGRVVLTASCNRGKFNESAQSEEHLKELPNLIGDRQRILIEDRGYPSLPHLIRLNNAGEKFVIRLKTTDFKAEQKAMKNRDEIVNIKINNSRLRHYIGTPEENLLASVGALKLRFVKIQLKNDVEEYLATNLPGDEFSAEDIDFIYHQRWGVETAFEVLKNKLQCENFTGIIPSLLEQDIYASIFVLNLAMHLVGDAESAREADVKLNKKTKHPMAVNRNFAIEILKRSLCAIILASADMRPILIDELINQIKLEVLPVRCGRTYVRRKGVLAGKFSNSHKRPF
jgi:hypothetical protein